MGPRLEGKGGCGEHRGPPAAGVPCSHSRSTSRTPSQVLANRASKQATVGLLLPKYVLLPKSESSQWWQSKRSVILAPDACHLPGRRGGQQVSSEHSHGRTCPSITVTLTITLPSVARLLAEQLTLTPETLSHFQRYLKKKLFGGSSVSERIPLP